MTFWQNVEIELEYKNMSRKELAAKAGFAVSEILLGIFHNNSPSADVAGCVRCFCKNLISGKDSRFAHTMSA